MLAKRKLKLKTILIATKAVSSKGKYRLSLLEPPMAAVKVPPRRCLSTSGVLFNRFDFRNW